MTKDNIIIAALRLFLARGYKSVSLIDVANELGMTKGGIYHYFSSKDELLHASLHFFLDRFEEKYLGVLNSSGTLYEIVSELLAGNTFEEYSHKLLGIANECGAEHIHFAIEMMRKFSDVQERIQRSQVTICEAFAARIQQAVAQGQLRKDLDSYALAAAIMAMVNGQKSLGSHFQTPVMRERLMKNVWTLMNQ